MFTVDTTATIAAPPAVVWDLIVDFDAHHPQWLGTVESPHLFAARHEFILEPDGEGVGTAVRHRGCFTGVLVLFLTKTLRATEEGFHALNLALRQRAEKAAGVRRVE